MSNTTFNRQSLTGHLLIAMPNLGDQRFHNAVILICADDKDGAMGLVLNQLHAEYRLPELLEGMDMIPQRAETHPKCNMPVRLGGPMESGRGFLLHSADHKPEGTIKITDELYIAGSQDSLIDLSHGHGAENNLFFLGYAGWEEGQLHDEILDNAWLTLPATAELIFNSKTETLWVEALHNLGCDPEMLSGQSGRA